MLRSVMSIGFIVGQCLLNAAHAQGVGNFSCKVDDKSEVYDGDRSVGHEFRDLDGIQSDKEVVVGLRVQAGSVLLQEAFAGIPQKAITPFKVLSSMPGRDKTTLVAMALEPVTGSPRLLVFIQDLITGKSGFTLTVGRYATPEARGEESFAMVDVMLGHCEPAEP